jgi:hypothetical protein
MANHCANVNCLTPLYILDRPSSRDKLRAREESTSGRVLAERARSKSERCFSFSGRNGANHTADQSGSRVKASSVAKMAESFSRPMGFLQTSM